MITAASPREVRARQNQAMFEDAGARRAAVLRERGTVELLCECSWERCRDRIRVPAAEYVSVRNIPGYFLVAPEHVAEDAERVVLDCGDVVVVEQAAPATAAGP
jgi:hypothetical protein